MKHFVVVDSAKTFEETCFDLNAAVEAHNFGILAIHDLAATLRSKNIQFSENCSVFEVCNPQQAALVLETDMSLCMALPCRISVFTEVGQTKIAMIRPADLFRDLSDTPALIKVALEVESTMMDMIHEASSPTAKCSDC
ncbi:DUF302 domain-containing protein [Synechococcus sp. CS-1330]|nr:DUF302 domain-containing protein [Synechococcus sp. CS-1330]